MACFLLHSSAFSTNVKLQKRYKNLYKNLFCLNCIGDYPLPGSSKDGNIYLSEAEEHQRKKKNQVARICPQCLLPLSVSCWKQKQFVPYLWQVSKSSYNTVKRQKSQAKGGQSSVLYPLLASNTVSIMGKPFFRLILILFVS